MSLGQPEPKDVERSLLSCALYGGPSLAAISAEVMPAWFEFAEHRLIWDVIGQFQAADRPLDLMLLQQHFLEHSTPEGAPMMHFIGGPHVILEIAGCQLSPDNWPHFANLLKERYIRRRIVRLGVLAEKLSRDQDREPEALLQDLEAELFEIHTMQDTTEAVPIREGLIRHVGYIEIVYSRRGQIPFGITTGIADLDRTINGLEAGEFFAIGARPGVGKTNWLNRLVESISLRDANPVPGLYFSLEMTLMHCLTRMTHGHAGIEVSKGRTGTYSPAEDLPAYRATVEKWSPRPLWIDESADLTIAAVMARIRLAVRRWGIKIIFIDYLQLIQPVTKRGLAEERLGIVEVCHGLKTIAKQLGLVVISLAQASRGSEDNAGKVPGLRDFDGSSAIEKYADYAAFLHRPCKIKEWSKLGEKEREFYGFEEDYLAAAQLLLLKNRHGPESKIPLRFINELARFEPVTKDLYSNNPEKRQRRAG